MSAHKHLRASPTPLLSHATAATPEPDLAAAALRYAALG